MPSNIIFLGVEYFIFYDSGHNFLGKLLYNFGLPKNKYYERNDFIWNNCASVQL